MPLADLIAQAVEPESVVATPPTADYIGDLSYHNHAYMIEQALRDLSVLPDPAKNMEPSLPYDNDLKRLIEAVPLE